MSKSKMTLEGGIFLVTNLKLSGGKDRKTDKVDPNTYHPEMVETAPTGANVTANVTVQVLEDPAEYERAEGIREAVRKKLADVATTQTPLGLMAPHSKQVELDQAIVECRAMIEAYNTTAKRTRIVPWIVQMAMRADASTIKQVAEEVKALLDSMDAGIKARDADAIREAVKHAKMYAEMMDEEHGEKVIAAIEEVRRHAREVAKAVKDRGDAALSEVLLCDSEARKSALNAARAAFLDVDLGEEPTIDAIPVEAPRALDVDVEEGEEDAPVEDVSLAEKVAVEETINEDDVDASRAVDARRPQTSPPASRGTSTRCSAVGGTLHMPSSRRAR